MMTWILVGAGGALGSLARFQIGKAIMERNGGTFPLGTFAVNLAGAVLLGAVSTLPLNQETYLLAADGFLGAFTTFSTFMYEGFNLIQDNERGNAVLYIAGSFVLGVGGYYLGAQLTALLL